ncbi:MAG: phage protein Gp27 family protein [Christensenella sp.]
MKKKRRRKHSIIDALPSVEKDTVEQMLLNDYTYSEVVDYLKSKGTSISQASVCRYASNFLENLEMLNIAQENFRRMMDEMRKYPDIDTGEAIIRLASQHVFSALANVKDEDISGLDFTKLVREASSLIKAGAYKNRLDIQSKNDAELGVDAVKDMLFETMAREKPELYKQVITHINSKVREER